MSDEKSSSPYAEFDDMVREVAASEPMANVTRSAVGVAASAAANLKAPGSGVVASEIAKSSYDETSDGFKSGTQRVVTTVGAATIVATAPFWLPVAIVYDAVFGED